MNSVGALATVKRRPVEYQDAKRRRWVRLHRPAQVVGSVASDAGQDVLAVKAIPEAPAVFGLRDHVPACAGDFVEGGVIHSEPYHTAPYTTITGDRGEAEAALRGER